MNDTDDSGSTTELARDLAAALEHRVLDPMKHAFIDKDEIIDLLGVALVGGENLFLLGPPGTAKSALVSDLARRLHGDSFEYLLTRFTEPGELFGPFDIRKLREGELVTSTEGMLPEADLVFLDELLNASSAILNGLLTVLNERVFRRGRETRQLSILVVVGASNSLPEDPALAALFDRFLLRARCDGVPGDRLDEVLEAGWKLELEARDEQAGLQIESVRQLHGLLTAVDLGAVRAPLVQMVERMRRAGIAVSDRRAVKLQRAAAASALLSGRLEARPSDLWVLRHTWDTLEQEEVLTEIVERALADEPTVDDDHRRARGDTTPDPEALARDLDNLTERLAGLASSAPERTAIADRLGLLAARCQWVPGETARAALDARVEELWVQLGGGV